MFNNQKKLELLDSEENKIKQNLNHLKAYFRNRIYPEWQNGVKAYNMDSTDRRMMDAWCAQVKSDYYMPYTNRQVNNVFNKLYDTQNQYEVHEQGWELYTCEDHEEHDKKWEKMPINPSEKISDIVEDSFQTPDNRRDFFTAVKSTLIVGNGYIESWIRESRGQPETMLREVGSFSLYFFTNQDFYESGLPVVKRQIVTLSNIIQALDWYGIDIKEFKAVLNEEMNKYREKKLQEDAKKKASKQNGKDWEDSEKVNRSFDKRDDEKIWEARFHGDFLISQCQRPKAKCNTCKKDECTCVKLPWENKLVGKAHPLDALYSYDDNDAMHEFSLYWTREYLFVIIDDLVTLKYANPISNPCGEMSMEEKEKLADMEKRLKAIKVGKTKAAKVANKKRKEELMKEIELYKDMFEVDYFGPYHPYSKLDIDPNSRSKIQMWLGPNGYKEQLLYNAIFNQRVDKHRTISDLTSMFTMGEDQEIALPSGVELKNGQMPMIPWMVLKIKGDWPGLRTLGEGLTMGPNDLNLLNFLDATSDRASWLTSVTWWAEKGIQRVPWAVQALTQVTAQNLQPLVESMSHAMSRIIIIWQRLLLNWMDKKWIDKIDVRKRRGWTVELTREDLKRDFHVVVNNKSLTTLQNFNNTIQKINAVGQIQGLLTNPVNGNPYFDLKPIVQELLQDLDLSCDVELTDKEVYDMKEKGIRENTKLNQLQAKEQTKVQYTQIKAEDKLQDRILALAAKKQEQELARQQEQGAFVTNPQGGVAPQQWGAVLWNILPEEQLTQLSQVLWIPVEELAQLTEQEFTAIEQQFLAQQTQRPLIEEASWPVWWADLWFF